MKRSTTLVLVFLSTSVLFAQDSLEQDYTTMGLPHGALMRLDKGESSLVAWSRDGERLAVGGTIGIWVYDTETGDEVSLLAGHRREVVSMEFSPDGTILASASGDYTVRLWDTATWQERGILTGHTHRVNSVVFSPDGTTLASGGSDNTVRLWDLATGHEKNHPDWTYTRRHFGGIFTGWDHALQAAAGTKQFGYGTRPQGVRKTPSRDTRRPLRPWCFRRMGRHWPAPAGERTVRLWDVATGEQKGAGRDRTKLVARIGGVFAGREDDGKQRLRQYCAIVGRGDSAGQSHSHRTYGDCQVGVVFAGWDDPGQRQFGQYGAAVGHGHPK